MTRIIWSRNGASGYKQSYLGALTVQTQTVVNKLDSDFYESTTMADAVASDQYFTINLPATATIEKLGLKYIKSFYNSGSIIIETSLNNDGITGFTTFYSGACVYNDYHEVSGAPVQCKWIRIRTAAGGQGFFLSNLFLFGNITLTGNESIHYKLYDLDLLTELTSPDYLLDYGNIGNRENFLTALQFHIYNDFNFNKTYILTIVPLKYPTDSVITNNVKLSYAGAGFESALSQIQFTVNANSFSDTVSVFANIESINNPADGKHFFYVDIVEL